MPVCDEINGVRLEFTQNGGLSLPLREEVEMKNSSTMMVGFAYDDAELRWLWRQRLPFWHAACISRGYDNG